MRTQFAQKEKMRQRAFSIYIGSRTPSSLTYYCFKYLEDFNKMIKYLIYLSKHIYRLIWFGCQYKTLFYNIISKSEHKKKLNVWYLYQLQPYLINLMRWTWLVYKQINFGLRRLEPWHMVENSNSFGSLNGFLRTAV